VSHSWMTPVLARRGAVPMLLLLFVLLAYAACPSRAGEVYKSVDAEGHVVYSDRADTSTAKKSVVQVDLPDPTEVARLAKEQEILKTEDIQRKRQKAVEDAKKAQADHAAQVLCESAQNRYYALKDARRVYQRDADGNRLYLTDPEADAKREEARQAMKAACGS
jgi:Domain of unknown function (DUF4124)